MCSKPTSQHAFIALPNSYVHGEQGSKLHIMAFRGNRIRMAGAGSLRGNQVADSLHQLDTQAFHPG
jgi:hypothetical protein